MEVRMAYLMEELFLPARTLGVRPALVSSGRLQNLASRRDILSVEFHFQRSNFLCQCIQLVMLQLAADFEYLSTTDGVPQSDCIEIEVGVVRCPRPRRGKNHRLAETFQLARLYRRHSPKYGHFPVATSSWGQSS